MLDNEAIEIIHEGIFLIYRDWPYDKYIFKLRIKSHLRGLKKFLSIRNR